MSTDVSKARGRGKDIPLEALRGIAAVTVVAWHTMLGFYPQGSGIFPTAWPRGEALTGQIWFGLINGTAAVTLFFVLSGLVLTRRYFLGADPRSIGMGAVKRWPRLAGPVLVTVVLSWALFRLGAYRYAQAGAVTNSPWLSAFAYGIGPDFRPDLWDAARQGAYLTFLRGDASYDSSLWTMRLEFIGSFLCFGLALLMGTLPAGAALARALIVIIVIALCHVANPQYVAFPAGVALAAALPARHGLLPSWTAAAMIVAGVYLFGCTAGMPGAFAPLAGLAHGMDLTEIYALAAVLVIVALELAPEGFRAPLSGRLAEYLGRLSFPLYLVHVLMLCSAGCAAFLLMQRAAPAWHPRMIAALVTAATAVLAALPLVWFNEAWVRWVNRAAAVAGRTEERIAPPRPTSAGGAGEPSGTAFVE